MSRPHFDALGPAFALALSLGGAACTAGGGEEETSESGEAGSESGADALPTEGLLGCPEGSTCTILLVSQSLDDRIELFTLEGPGPLYRGAISVDLDPNPEGDISDDALDEPFDARFVGERLWLSVGHYPERLRGRILGLDPALLAAQAAGETLAVDAWFDGVAFSSATVVLDPGAREAIHMFEHPSGRVLASAFANDLFAAPEDWTDPGQLALFDGRSTDDEIATRSLADFGDCDGAWRPVPLDAEGSRVALACDGVAAGVALLDTSGLGEGELASALDGVEGCVASMGGDARQIRWVAPAGEGILVADSPAIADQSAAVLWNFDAQCQLLGAVQWDGPTSWDFRGLELHPARPDRWALLNAGNGEAMGVHIVDASGQSCRRLETLDSLWPEGHVPIAARWLPEGDSLVVAGGPRSSLDDAGAPGALWRLDFAGDPCSAEVELEDLLAPLPAFDAAQPATWRRAGASLSIASNRPR